MLQREPDDDIDVVVCQGVECAPSHPAGPDDVIPPPCLGHPQRRGRRPGSGQGSKRVCGEVPGNMNWVYMDESGDDGFAAYPNCSRYFMLTSLSLDESSWRRVFGQLQTLRAQLKQQYGLPSKTEIHAGPMIRGNEPYRTLMGLATRPALASAFLMDYLKAVAQLQLSIVNVAVDKATIVTKWPAKPRSDFDVLDIAFRYSLQRLEISIRATNSNFAVVVDQGRLGAMRKVARKATRFNYVNSSIGNVITCKP